MAGTIPDKKKNNKTLLTQVILSIHGILVLFFLLSLSSAIVSPADFWPMAIIGLIFPYILAVNVLMILFWLIIGKKYFLIPLLIIILSWGEINKNIRIKISNDKPDTPELSLMTYNVHFFKSPFENIDTKKNKNSISGLIKNYDVDILCLQEYKAFSNAAEDVKKFRINQGFSHAVFKNYHSGSKGSKQLLAIFTRDPVINKGYLKDQHRVFAIYADIIRDKDTLRVYNTHLQSIYFRQDDYQFISDLASNRQNNEEWKKNTVKILKKLKTAYIIRAEQAKTLKEHLNQSPHKNILAGDFNDVPSSYVYALLSNNYNDAFRKFGKGSGRTFAGELPFHLRIDYILSHKYWEFCSFEIVKKDFSDHYPLIAGFVKKQTP